MIYKKHLLYASVFYNNNNSNDMFLAFPYFKYDYKIFSFSYDFWFPKNEYKIFIYSKANVQKDVENVYYCVPFIDEISICFVKEDGIKNMIRQWQDENPTAYDAIPHLDACESYSNFTHVFFYAEDMIKEKLFFRIVLKKNYSFYL